MADENEVYATTTPIIKTHLFLPTADINFQVIEERDLQQICYFLFIHHILQHIA
jgi:hypothetical protein